ncbi:MAG: hypothetical protein K2N58_03040 [Treponemataceae bacterium]|nr:hypothetical protein [Treponemataceae bacterium]
MLAKRTFAVILLSLALCLAGFSQTSGSVVVLQTELTNIQDSWLSNHLQNLIEENLQKYTDFTTVVDEAAERKVKEQQRRSESTAHSESDIIEIGKLVNAKYALFSYARKAGNAYTLTIHFTNLTTGVQRASITSRQYGKLEELYAHPGAVDEVTLALCERLGIILSTAQKYVLQHGEAELTINQQIELERKEQERFRQQMKDLDKQIIALKTSTEVDAETQQKKLEALRAMNEQKLKAAQEREKRLREDQKKRQADMVAEESRKKESIQRRNKMSAEIEIKVKNLRATKVQNANIMERIAFLETRKKTFNELQNELAKRKEEIDHAADEEFNLKKAEIEARPWRAAELADGEPTATAKERRNGEIESIMKKLKMQAEKEKFIVEKELQPTSRALLDEIITDYRNLENITVTISSIRNEKDVQYSIGTFNGDKNYWPVLLYFYNDGKESIGQYQTSISYQTVTGKKPFSEMSFYYNKEQEEEAYNDFLDTVDMYNSLFARTVPVLTYEVDYTVEPWTIPSQYRICFKKLRIKDTQSEKVLLNEDITDLDKIVSFSECEIQASYYAQIIPPNDKNIPGYLLYKFALEAKKNGNPAGISNLMRYAAEKKYTPALGYVERKEAEQSERQRMEAQAKAKEEKRKKDEKEKYKRRKAAARDALYDSPRLGFSLSGDFSPLSQNYAIEIKKMGKMLYYGGGVNVWLWNNKLDDFLNHALFGLSIPLKRFRPYIELGGGFGIASISGGKYLGLYGYAKGGVEARISPHISIEAFCKPQYAKMPGNDNVYRAGSISGGVSITFWKIFN